MRKTKQKTQGKRHFTNYGDWKPSLFLSTVVSIPIFAIALILGMLGHPKGLDNFLGTGGSSPFAPILLYSVGVALSFFCLFRILAFSRWWSAECKDSGLWRRFEPLVYAFAFVLMFLLPRILLELHLPVWLLILGSLLPLALYWQLRNLSKRDRKKALSEREGIVDEAT